MSRKLFALAVLAVLSLAASPAAAKDDMLYARLDTRLAPTQADLQVCADEARGVKPRTVALPAYAPNAYAAAGAALAAGFVESLQQARARNAYLDACMREKGYGKLRLTAEEAAELEARKDRADQLAWIDGFLARDLDARISAARIPAVPPFAAAADEPFVVGAVRLDPAALRTAAGPVALKQPLLTGPIGYRRTAVLGRDLKVQGILDTRAEAGAVFHQLVFGGGSDAVATQWCGPVANNSIRGRVRQPYCFVAEFEGYRATPVRGETWLATGGAVAAPVDKIDDGLLILEAAPAEALDLALALTATRFTKAGVLLRAVAVHDGKSVEFWSGFVPLDAEGRGRLPFWTHVLNLQRADKGLTAELAATGDGRGWSDLAAAP